MIFIQDISRIL